MAHKAHKNFKLSVYICKCYKILYLYPAKAFTMVYPDEPETVSKSQIQFKSTLI